MQKSFFDRLWSSSRVLIAAGFVLTLCLSGQVYSQFDVFKPYVEETEAWAEAKLEFPPFPQPAGMVAFSVSVSPHRYAIDSSSIALGADGVTRFVLIITTTGGAINTTYEGMRCATHEHRTLAYGRNDKTWSPARTRWSKLVDRDFARLYPELMRLYVCDERGQSQSPAQIIGALRNAK
jgi:CNP1-like family